MAAEDFSKFVDKALEHLKRHTKMDGFRAGTVPKDIVEKKIGSENVLMEAGDLAVKDAYAKYVNENNLEPVAHPDVKIGKIAKGSPFEFTVTVSVMPEIELPDYKKVVEGVKAKEVALDPAEIDEALKYLQKSRAKFTDKTEPAAKKDYVKIEYQNEHVNSGKPVRDMFIIGEAGFLPDFEDNVIGMKVGDEKEFTAKFPENAPNNLGGKEGKFKVKMLAVQIMELPEINDEFAKALGAFDTLVALKENMKEGITLEKKQNEKHRARTEMIESIAAKTSFEIPESMVEYEQERLLEDLKNQVAQNFRLAFEEYLKTIKKTEEELKGTFKLEAQKRIKQFLVLRAVGKAEQVEIPKEELEEEMNRQLRRYPKEEADKIDIGQLKEYSKDVLFNEKVFQKLESFAK